MPRKNKKKEIVEIPIQDGFIYAKLDADIPIIDKHGNMLFVSPLDIPIGARIASLRLEGKVKMSADIARSLLFENSDTYKEAFNLVYTKCNGLSIPKMAYHLYFGWQSSEFNISETDTITLEQLISTEFYNKERSEPLSNIDKSVLVMVALAANKYKDPKKVKIMTTPAAQNWLKGTRRTYKWEVYQALSDFYSGWDKINDEPIFREWIKDSEFHKAWVTLSSAYRELSMTFNFFASEYLEMEEEKTENKKRTPVIQPKIITKEMQKMLKQLGINGLNEYGLGLIEIYPVAIAKPKIVEDKKESRNVKAAQYIFNDYISMKTILTKIQKLRDSLMDVFIDYLRLIDAELPALDENSTKSSVILNLPKPGFYYHLATLQYFALNVKEDQVMLDNFNHVNKLFKHDYLEIVNAMTKELGNRINSGKLDNFWTDKTKDNPYLKEYNSIKDAIKELQALTPLQPDRVIEFNRLRLNYAADELNKKHGGNGILSEKLRQKTLERINELKDSLYKSYGNVLNLTLLLDIPK